MKKSIITLFFVILLQTAACATGDDNQENDKLAKDLLSRGIKLVHVESSQSGYLKEKTEKSLIIFARVELIGKPVDTTIYNPWATFYPYCTPITDDSTSRHHIGIIILDQYDKITDILYEANVPITIKDSVKLSIVSGEKYSPSQKIPHNVIAISSSRCSDRAIYWSGSRFDLLLNDEDFNQLP